jgi:hypothetical protein
LRVSLDSLVWLEMRNIVGRRTRMIATTHASWPNCCIGISFTRSITASSEPGVCRRAEFYYQQFDALAALRQDVRRELLFAVQLLRQIPSIGPIRAALLVALIQTPHRFRTKRQF